MDVFSNFVYNNMPGFTWTGRNVGMALLFKVPGTVTPSAPASVDVLVASTGYQELAVAGYSRQTTNVNSVTTTYTSVVVGADFSINITSKSYVAAAVFYLASPTANVTNKALTSNVATLTTSAAHGFTTGQTVVVAGVGAPFDGSYTIASTPTGTTFTYAKTNANITSTAATGTATISFSGTINPWLFITDVCFRTVVTPGSKIRALGSPQTLFAYSIAGTTVTPAIGQLVQAPGPQEWESSRMYHVYLYPERVNWVPNPSFEDVGNFGWRANGTITRNTGGVDATANHYLNVAGTRLESIPLGSPNGNHRLSMYVRSAGATWVKVGLMCYESNFTTTVDVLSQQRFVSTGWAHMDAMIPSPDNTAGTAFLVVSDGAFDIDLVLMESIADLNQYFDGATTTGAVGDFSWQGVAHQSYSFWYNNRYLVGARIFGQYVEGLVTKKGLVYDWIPFDTALATHWNVLFPNDTRHPLKDWASRTIP